MPQTPFVAAIQQGYWTSSLLSNRYNETSQQKMRDALPFLVELACSPAEPQSSTLEGWISKVREAGLSTPHSERPDVVQHNKDKGGNLSKGGLAMNCGIRKMIRANEDKFCFGDKCGRAVSSNDLLRRIVIIVEINDTTLKEKLWGEGYRLKVAAHAYVILDFEVVPMQNKEVASSGPHGMIFSNVIP
ncbi:hypothetical protein VNO77_34211 [Canavalia gladiata]|uniref:Uncharacterized protein n=1 Tax=Canavalia gladiata TaxID=3824 RepID=A0AAN9KDV3_CANGL